MLGNQRVKVPAPGRNVGKELGVCIRVARGEPVTIRRSHCHVHMIDVIHGCASEVFCHRAALGQTLRPGLLHHTPPVTLSVVPET